MEKIKLSNKGREIEIYDSYAPYRLKDETFDEYKLRQSVIKDLEKAMKNNRNMVHISSMLVPKMTPDGKIAKKRGTTEIEWIGITKGITYIKPKENGEQTEVGDQVQEQ